MQAAPERPGIFISYSHAERSFVERLAADLEKAGAEVWLDELKIKVGERILDRISEGIATTRYFGVVLSPSSMQSEWVKLEINVAFLNEIEHKKVTVLPLLFRPCEIPVHLRDRKYADFSGDYQLGLARLLERLDLPAVPQDRPAARRLWERLSLSTRATAALFLVSLVVLGILLARQASGPAAGSPAAEAVTGDEAALQLLSEALVEIKNDRFEDAFTSLGEVEKTARSDLVEARAQVLRLLIALSLSSANADLEKLALAAYGRAAGGNREVLMELTVRSTLQAFQWSDRLAGELDHAVASGLPVALFSKVQLSNPTSPQSLHQIESHQALARGAALTSAQAEEARSFVAAQTFRFHLAAALQPDLPARELLANDLMSGEMHWSPGIADALDRQMSWVYDHGVKLGAGLHGLPEAERQKMKAIGHQEGLGKDLDAAFAAAILRSYRPFLEALLARGGGASAATRLGALDRQLSTLASYTAPKGATP